MATIKYVVLWANPEQPAGLVFGVQKETPYGPPRRGEAWDGWSVYAVRDDRDDAARVVKMLCAEEQGRARLEAWTYEPGRPVRRSVLRA